MLDVDLFDNNGVEWLVRQFVIFSTESFVEEKFIPRPDVSIIFHFKEKPFVLDHEVVQLEPFFVAPIIPKCKVLNLPETMDSFVVICKPTVFSRVFDIDLSPNCKQSIDLPPAVFQPLWYELSQMKTTQERISLFIDFVNGYQKSPYKPDAIDIFYDKIREKWSTCLLKDIAKDCPACNRTLERYFVKRTGVTPKMLMRIMRADYLYSKIINEGNVDYQDLISQGKFFDQAHFIKDFKDIMGEIPNCFFNRDFHLTALFSGRAKGSVQ